MTSRSVPLLTPLNEVATSTSSSRRISQYLIAQLGRARAGVPERAVALSVWVERAISRCSIEEELTR